MDSIHNILIFFAEKTAKATHIFSKKFQHIYISLEVNFNESLTNDIVSFEQMGPDIFLISPQNPSSFFSQKKKKMQSKVC